MRPKLFALVALATMAASIIAAEWPRFVTQAADEPASLPQPNRGAVPNAAAAKVSSPHDSPSAIYAEYVNALAAKEYRRGIACLSPDLQSIYAFHAIASALQLEFEPQSAEALQRTLARNGLDLLSLPPDVAGFIDVHAGWKLLQAEGRWKELVAQHIRDVPALLQDLEKLESEMRKGEDQIQFGVYCDLYHIRYGILRGLEIKETTATATTRVKRKTHFSPTVPREEIYAVNLTFKQSDGKWYLNSFEEKPVGLPQSVPPIALPPFDTGSVYPPEDAPRAIAPPPPNYPGPARFIDPD